MKIWKRAIYSVAVLGLVVSALGVGAVSTLAAGESPTEQKVVIGDNDTPRVLTIHKYNNLASAYKDGKIKEDDGKQQTIGSKDVNNPVDPGDYQPVGGVKFKVVQYIRDESVSQADSKNPVIAADGTLDLAKSKGWKKGTVEMTAATSATGEAVFNLGDNTDVDGVYVVTELPIVDINEITINGKQDPDAMVVAQVQPFLVYVPMTDRDTKDTIMYNIDINPKNELTTFSVAKSIQTVGQQNYSVNAKEQFQWIINGKLSTFNETQAAAWDLSSPSQLFQIMDGIDPNMEVVANTWRIRYYDTLANLKADTSNTAGVAGTVMAMGPTPFDSTNSNTRQNYTLLLMNQDLKNNLVMAKNQYFKISVTTQMKDENFNGIVANDVMGSYIYWLFDKEANSDKQGGILVSNNVPTIPPKMVDPGDPNAIFDYEGFKLLEVPTDNKDNPDTPKSITPDYYTGGFDVKKVKAEDGKVMPGVEFKLALNEADAKAGKFVTRKITASDGTITETPITAITDASGIAQFNGLALEWQTTPNADGSKDNVSKLADIKKDYWIVETKSIAGYELLKEALKVTINLNTGDNKTAEGGEIPEITVANYQNGELPKTGGSGKVWVVALAVTFMAGSLGLIIYKKRQENIV